jgi:Asp-tRNA(Asn)/Glu-tRNA(Gln) amidotransferase C subunit
MTQTRREADILLNLIEARYGDHVTPEELEEIRKGLNAILDSAKTIRAVKLENGDEPYQFFKPSGEPE